MFHQSWRAPRSTVVGIDELRQTQHAFDSVAASYDESNTRNPVLRAMRERTLATVIRHVPAGSSLLDLGCGPGSDAETLARAGYRVTAVDWSPEMVEAAQTRIQRAGLARQVEVRHLGIHQLDELPGAVFDAAYSSFGPLNCVPDLRAAAALIHRRIRPRGTLIASVIGRVCPWELVLYGLRGDWRRAAVRLSSRFVRVPLNGRTVWTRYYAPGGFVDTFGAAGFALMSLRALGLLAPPPYLDGFARRRPRLVTRLLALEDRVAAWPGLNQIGDHFLVAMVKHA